MLAGLAVQGWPCRHWPGCWPTAALRCLPAPSTSLA